ncbi:hypothetical protein PRIPAC_82485 [Pristionchus pacificus]|uniref:Uncharacterized protein n=1 Tax=Pristionchus pacificus TaxID=54126 RepID=A0A2A6C2Q7_PRIPA|nr:hypothetical protein PRIPAC_82485 [Pristionchus pacificus]|eukprot:PDM72377.1 hypothetical protein PRIPAC_38811 [Pristionchus pacificus]
MFPTNNLVFALFFIISIVSSQLHTMPGSYSGAIANGRGGLGRYLRHLEHHDDTSYYPYGNGFGSFKTYPVFGFFG